MAKIKWTHEDVNNKIQEVMQVKQPGKEGLFPKISLGDILNQAKAQTANQQIPKTEL